MRRPARCSSWKAISERWKKTANCQRSPTLLHILSQIGGRFLGPPLEIEGHDEAALLVHKIDQRSVVHAVVAVLGGNFLGVDAVGLFGGVDRRLVAGAATQM